MIYGSEWKLIFDSISKRTIIEHSILQINLNYNEEERRVRWETM